MKALTTTLLLAGLLFGTTLSAQDVIVRQSNGTSYFYYPATNSGTELQTVLDQTLDGDTVYLPGVSYTLSSALLIRKGIVLIGTGIDPDTTAVSGLTTISSARVTESGSGAEFHGIAFGGFGFGESGSTTNVDGVRFVRCSFNTLGLGWSWSSTASTNTVIEQCIVNDQFSFAHSASAIIRNSVIVGTGGTGSGLTYGGIGCSVVNCMLVGYHNTGGGGTNNTGTYYQDNIILTSTNSTVYIAEQSTFVNNLWVLGSGGFLDLSGVPSASDNAFTTQMDSVFVNNSITSFTAFDWANDYHIVAAQYQTMGYNGGEVGIYGGDPLAAWKEGSLPFNPHWDLFDVPSATTMNGVLQDVHLRGTAQSH